jgi:hypothetical protein
MVLDFLDFYFLWTELIWSIDFVISKKKNFYWFSGRIRTFYRRKTGFYEKKISVALPSAVCRDFMAVQMKNFVRPLFGRCFQVRDFSFRITEGIGLAGVSFHFWPQKQIPSGSSHTNFWLLFHFHVKRLPILMFLGLIWCKILCWAQKSILYGVWNATESHESPKTEFVSHEIFISRVTYPLIRNFMLSSKSILYGV